MRGLVFEKLFLVLQQVEGKVIYPYVVGRTVGLRSIWVVVAVTFGGKTMGILGMLLFIPIASVCYALLGEYISGKTIKKEKTVKRKNVKIVDEKIIEEVDYDKM